MATLNVVLNEGTPEEVRRLVRIPLATRGTTRALAWLNIVGEGQAAVYVPNVDPPPTDPRWPKNLEAAAAELAGKTDFGGGGD